MFFLHIISAVIKFGMLMLAGASLGSAFLCGNGLDELLLLPFCGFAWLIALFFDKAAGNPEPFLLKTKWKKALAAVLIFAYGLFLAYYLEYI